MAIGLVIFQASYCHVIMSYGHNSYCHASYFRLHVVMLAAGLLKVNTNAANYHRIIPIFQASYCRVGCRHPETQPQTPQIAIEIFLFFRLHIVVLAAGLLQLNHKRCKLPMKFSYFIGFILSCRLSTSS